jgi:precorrin-6Y C5,15-methyltransferase (decarboxylating)
MTKNDLSQGVLRWIERAEVLVGGKRHLHEFADHPGEKIRLKAPLDEVLKSIEEISSEQRTLLLASGDPSFYGIGRRLVDLLGKERLLVLPNITAVQYLMAKLAEPWEDVKVVSLHGKGERADNQWLRALRRYKKIAVYTDSHHTPATIARQLLKVGLPDRLLIVGEDLGLATERVRSLSPQEAQAQEFSPLNLVLILSAEDSAAAEETEWPALGISDRAFQHQAGLITKMEVRAVVLANLQLKPDLVLWDLGAGSGSVSIEAARLVPLRHIVAVEKNPDRYNDLTANVAYFGCVEIQTLCGSASDVLDQLVDPDRVFLGGMGQDLLPVLDYLVHRLRPAGRIVQTVVTLDTLHKTVEFWRGKPFEVSVTQLQINRSAPILNTLRLEALNPVFVVTSWRRD